MDNGIMVQYFEWYLPADASLWKSVAKRAKDLASEGVTSIWLPPAYKGQAGINDVGYGVYDLYDLGEFKQKGTVPTKYGTKKEYIAAVKALRAAGISVYGDIVFNQMMGADETEDVKAVEDARNNRENAVSGEENIEAWTRFTFPGRKGKYSDFVWDHTCFDGVDWDQRKEKGAIYNFEGSPWDGGVDSENVNYDYLMGADVCFRNPKVTDHLKEWGQWYIDTAHVDGFRIDALKHITNTFFSDWLGTLRRNNKKEYFAVGEYWHQDVNVLEKYLDACGRCMSLFDVPLHFNFFCASHGGGNYDMRNILNGSLVQRDPEKAVTFVDNHDTQAGQALSSAIMDWFVPLAYAVILLCPQGYPCVFYGNYYGVPSHGGKSFRDVLDVQMRIRRTHVYGAQHDYLDDVNIIGWTLEGDDQHKDSGVAVLLTDNAGGSKRMYIGARHKGETFIDALGNQKNEVTIGDDGNAVFTVDGGSVSVWVRK
jgi:alpha-amylase